MTTKRKIVLVAVLVLGLSAASISVQYPQIASARAERVTLAKKNAALRKEVARLQAEWQMYDEQRQTWQTARAPGGDAEYVPVPIEFLKKMTFNIVSGEDLPGGLAQGSVNSQTPDFTLGAQAISLLGLTTGEASRLQNILTELQERIQAYQRASVKEITLKEVGLLKLFDYMNFYATTMGGTDWGPLSSMMATPSPFSDAIATREPGWQTVYEIPPMSDEDSAALQQWFFDSVTGVIGADRAGILRPNALNFADFWLSKGEYAQLAFADRVDPDTGNASTEWSSVIYNASGAMYGAGTWMGGAIQNPIPARWAYLFQAVNDDPTIRRKIAR